MKAVLAGPVVLIALALAAPSWAQGGGGFRVGQFPGGGQEPRPRGLRGMRDNEPQTGTAVLRGLVVGGETGAPLRRAIVRLSGDGMREGRIASTDEQGRWELRDLPAGRFSLSASKAGYVTLQFGQRRPFEQGRPVEVRDGQTLENVNFNLPRGGVIAGHVNDEFGEPVAEAMVMALRYRYFNGQRRLVPAGRFSQTDDEGSFRIYGLAPGDYYLSATLRTFMFGAGDSTSRSGYAPTYYPGTGSSQQAEKIAVGLGAEMTGITFSLLPVRTATITGTALDSQGRPMAGAFVQLVESSGDGGGGAFMMSFGGGTQVGENGHFRLTSVGPGNYTVMAREMRPGREGEGEVAEAQVSVGGEDITGLMMVGTKGATLHGQVLFDVQPAAGSVKPSSVAITATPKDPSAPPQRMFGPGMRDRVNDDWTFDLRAMTGPVVIRTFRTPPGYVLKAVLLNGQDVTDTGFAFRPGETVNGLQVVLTTQSGSVTGAVTDDRGQPVSDYAAVIFAEDRAKWGFLSRYVMLARPDQQGAFEAKPLPPGKYLAAAVSYIEDGEQTNPETLERLRSVATPFTLGEGGQQALTLKVVNAY
jgi:protocatechuate 3,4-dioxygenase beta subunit